MVTSDRLKSAYNFAQERSFLMVCFDQRQVNLRSPELDGQPREPGARTYVDHYRLRSRPCRIVAAVLDGGREQVPRCKQGFAKVAGNNFLRLPD